MAGKGKSEADRIRAALDDVVPFALSLPEAVESTSYGLPAIKRGDRWMLGLRKDDVTIAMRCSFEDRARLLRDHPKIFFITDHYLNYPAVVVNLANYKKKIVKDAITRAWDSENTPVKKRAAFGTEVTKRKAARSRSR
jgi:hypothetical protein